MRVPGEVPEGRWGRTEKRAIAPGPSSEPQAPSHSPKASDPRASHSGLTNMKQATLSVPELGIIAATRGMLAAGAMLLLAEKISVQNRKKIGWPLLAVGVLSTVPLAIDVIKKVKHAETDIVANA